MNVVTETRHFDDRSRWILVKMMENQRLSVDVFGCKAILRHLLERTFSQMRKVTNSTDLHAIKFHSAGIGPADNTGYLGQSIAASERFQYWIGNVCLS